jgi:SRSO17 transposase
LAYYACYGPRRTTVARLAAVAGARWAIEECFQQAKNDAGLDQYQVRDWRAWRAWHAHITLAMAAHAWLAIARTVATKGETAPTTA